MRYLDLERPHGFLILRGKQTAIAGAEPLPVGESILIISDGEAYGHATLSQPVAMTAETFDQKDWSGQHCVLPRERREWWPGVQGYYVHRITKWEPFEELKAVEVNEGQVVFKEARQLSEGEKALLDQARQYPKTVTLIEEAVSLNLARPDAVTIHPALEALPADRVGELVKAAQNNGEVSYTHTPLSDHLPLYSLALVRRPRLDIERLVSPGEKQFSGAMVAFYLDPTSAGLLALDPLLMPPDTEITLPQEMHLTLAYLGRVEEIADKQAMIIEVLRVLADECPPLVGKIGGTGCFSNDEGDGTTAFYASFDSPELPAFRQKLVERLAAIGVECSYGHGFTPHITLAYIPGTVFTPQIKLPNLTVEFSELALGWADDSYLFQMSRHKAASVTPPPAVQAAAAQALEWRQAYGRGMTPVGVARARDLSNGRAVSEETLQRMSSFFARHGVNRAEHYELQDGEPTTWRISWDGWGGDPGRAWAEETLAELDKKNKKKEHAVIEKLRAAAINVEDFRFIYVNRLNEDEYYFDIGDWGEQESIDGIIKLFGKDVQYANEVYPTNRGEWRQVWPSEEKMAEKAAMKTENGMEFEQAAFLYAPDAEKPGEWKLRLEAKPGQVTTRQLGLAAAALGPGLMGNRVELPPAARTEAAERLIREYRALETADEDIPDYLWAMAKMPAPKGEKGGLQEILDLIRAQFYAAFNFDDFDRPWVIDAYGDHLIAEWNGIRYRVMFEIDQAGQRRFQPQNSWEQVTTEYVTSETPVRMKAGRRLKGEFVDKLKDMMEFMGKLVSWAMYDDAEPEPEELAMFGNDAGVMMKMVDGQPWHFTWSANAFEDRDREIFSTKALESYVAEAEKRGERGFFNFWHIPGTDFARKEWQGMVGRFLVEAGPYLDNEAGQKALAFFKQYPDGHPEIAPEGWGSSVEYKYLPEERATGVYENIWITRTSTLPRMAAANIWTTAMQQEAKMNQQQKEAAVKLFGESFVSKLETDGQKRTEALEEAGVAHKAAGGEETPPAAKETQPGSGEAGEQGEETPAQTEEAAKQTAEGQAQAVEFSLDEVVEAVVARLATDLATPMVEAMTAVATDVAAVAEEVKAYQSRLAAVERGLQIKQATDTPRFVFNVKRASEADESQVADDDDLKSAKPKETAVTNGSMAGHFFPSR